jgi:hypothetical protein
MNGPNTASMDIDEIKVVVCAKIEFTNFETSFIFIFFLEGVFETL